MSRFLCSGCNITKKNVMEGHADESFTLLDRFTLVTQWRDRFSKKSSDKINAPMPFVAEPPMGFPDLGIPQDISAGYVKMTTPS